jgi:hypothetical protein
MAGLGQRDRQQRLVAGQLREARGLARVARRSRALAGDPREDPERRVDLGRQRGVAGGLVQRALAQADRFGHVVDGIREPPQDPRALGAGRDRGDERVEDLPRPARIARRDVVLGGRGQSPPALFVVARRGERRGALGQPRGGLGCAAAPGDGGRRFELARDVGVGLLDGGRELLRPLVRIQRRLGEAPVRGAPLPGRR